MPLSASSPVAESPLLPPLLDEQPFDGAGLGCWEVDVVTDIARYSRRWAEQLGYEHAQLRAYSGNWRQMCHPDDLPQVERAVERLLDGHDACGDTELRIRRRDGSWQWVRSLGQVSRRQADGRPRTLAGVHIDIGSHRAQRESLERHEQRLRLALSAGNEGWWDWQLDGDRCEYGDYWTTLFGAPPNPDAQGIDAWLDRVHRDDLPALHAALAICRDDPSARLDHEHRVIAADGQPRWVQARACIVRHDSDGGARRLAGVIVDISARKQADLALARSTALIEAVQALQQRFIARPDLRQLGDELLRTMLEFGEAEYGFIGEVLHDARGAPYLKTFTLTNIAWNDEMRALYAAHHADGLEFRNLDTLFGETLRTGQLVIANTPSAHHAARGLPKGHPALNTYAGVPIHDGRQLIGMVGLGNRHAGFDDQVLELIRPLTATIGVMIKAVRSERERVARADELLRVSRLAIAAEARLREITDGLPAVVFQFSFSASHRAHFNFVSRAIQQIAGTGPDLITSRPRLFLRRVLTEDRRKLLHALARCRGPAESMQLSFRLRDAGGSPRWLEATLSRGAGEVWNGFLFDVSQRKRSERELCEARDSADAANRAKSSFIATISHEIRTPLHGALGLIELMKLAPLDPGQADNLRLIESSGKSLLRLIDDLLDFSRMERGQMEIRSEPVALRDELVRSAGFWSEAARAKQLRLQLDIDPAVPAMVSIDALRLRQILDNLLSNAIKFTASGGVRLQVRPLSTAPKHCLPGCRCRLQFEVSDSGIGIPAHLQQRLFRPFVQADHGTARQFGGSGLGLSIARGLAERMGGSLELASQPGHGTTLSLTLDLPCLDEPQKPAALPTAAGHDVAAGAIARRQTVLIAEDNPVNRILVAQQLRHLGYLARIADSGEQALAIWREGGCALLLTDCHMGGMDGFALTRAIRREEQARSLPAMPIIACTADVYAGIVETCLGAGMNGWIGKPVSLETLRHKLAKWLGEQRSAQPADSADPPAPAAAALPLHDPAALLQLTGGDEALGQALCAAFRASLDAEREAVRTALDNGDLPATQRSLHRLLGACRSACVPRLAQQVSALEDAARCGDRGPLQDGWPALVALIADTADRLSPSALPELVQR